MNLKKLVRFNLARPIDQRLAVADIVANSQAARMRGNAVAMLEQIRIEIAPKLAEMRKADEIIDRIGSVSGMFPDLKVENYGYLTEPGGFEKYNPEVNHYKMATGNQSDLASDNDSFAGLYKQASQKAAHDTNNVANGVWQADIAGVGTKDLGLV